MLRPRSIRRAVLIAAISTAVLHSLGGCGKQATSPQIQPPNFRAAVVDTDGTPAAGAAVTISSLPPLSFHVDFAAADSRGLLFLVLPEGPHLFDVISARHTVVQETLSVPSLGTDRLDLTRAGAFRGRVLGQGGAPVESAMVSCVSNFGPVVYTNPSGRYQLGDIPRGTVDLLYISPQKPGAISYTVFQPATLPAVGDTVDLPDLQLIPPVPGRPASSRGTQHAPAHGGFGLARGR